MEKLKICVIGNSHTASLNQAWSKIFQDFSDIQITFFALHARDWSYLHMRKSKNGHKVIGTERRDIRKLFQLSSCGHSEINLCDFDVFLFYGFDLHFPVLDKRYSEEVRTQTIYDAVNKSSSCLLLNRFRLELACPVFFAHVPLPSRQLARYSDPPINIDFMPYNIVLDQMQFLLKKFNVTLLAQPEKTIGCGLVTEGQYCKNSHTMAENRTKGRKHNPGDVIHMNQAYGELFLELNLPIIEGLSDRGSFNQ